MQSFRPTLSGKVYALVLLQRGQSVSRSYDTAPTFRVLVPRGALTHEGAGCVITESIRVAMIGPCTALVDVGTRDAGARPPGVAGAGEGAGAVRARCVRVAVVEVQATEVSLAARPVPRPPGVARAREAALRVRARRLSGAVVRPRKALEVIQAAHLYVHPCPKAH
eukprot:3940957-Rhodomonas_salina.1